MPETITYLATIVENALVFERSNGEKVNFTVQHYGKHHEVDIAIYVADDPLAEFEEEIHLCDAAEDEPWELVTLSYQEARLLRDLLNREEVQQYLDQD